VTFLLPLPRSFIHTHTHTHTILMFLPHERSAEEATFVFLCQLLSAHLSPPFPLFLLCFLSVTVPPGRWLADRILGVDNAAVLVFLMPYALCLMPYALCLMPYAAVPPGRWMADRILEVDKINPQNAASLSSCFSTFRRYDQPRQQVCFVSILRVVFLCLLTTHVNHTCMH